MKLRESFMRFRQALRKYYQLHLGIGQTECRDGPFIFIDTNQGIWQKL
ncbi:Protein of unknown function [Pyronema omphalodes CBS 100304]|uniref:Uncharacterized protein n=1 Tax=Pyronema omphalodes (strain CBS 100304) TaxID=1076935 RepID=U4KTR2_PYROM|nr:Protein of unknown function [Pyronema omphalodes CBS 100304]